MDKSAFGKKKIEVSLNTEDFRNPTSSSPTSLLPTSPTALTKAPSLKHNCLCSPTNHAGSFRCRYHRNPGLTRASGSIGSKLSELGSVTSKLSDLDSKPPTMKAQLHPD
ncbi:hypothetical protein NMG60_11035252 [Bertholletia excelsa]